MHKVVIERPRWSPGPGKQGRRANLPDELLPKFEGIKRPHTCRKGLTDLLSPLKRWLRFKAYDHSVGQEVGRGGLIRLNGQYLV